MMQGLIVEYAMMSLPRLHVLVTFLTAVVTAQEASKCESIQHRTAGGVVHAVSPPHCRYYKFSTIYEHLAERRGSVQLYICCRSFWMGS